MRWLFVTDLLYAPWSGSNGPFLVELLHELTMTESQVAVLCGDTGDYGHYPGGADLHSRLRVVHELRTSKSRYGDVAGVPAMVERVLAAVRPDAVVFNNLNGILSVVEAFGRREIKLAYLPTDFGMVCPNVHLYQNSLQPCSGPESPMKCVRCVRERLGSRVGGRIGTALLSSPLGKLFRPNSPWLPVLRQGDAFRRRCQGVLGRFDRVYCACRVMMDMMGRYGVRSHSLVHLPWGISEIKRGRGGIPPTGEYIHIGYLGHAGHTKGSAVVMHAMERLPAEARVMLHVYNNTIAAQWRGRVSRPDHICFHVPFGPWDITRALSPLHAVVIPSIWLENSPLVALEALANKRPVIASDVLGVSEHVRDGLNGRLFAPGDADALSRIIEELQSHPSTLEALSGNCGYDRTVKDYAREMIAGMQNEE